MENLQILFASSEVVPFAKTGGLADVSGMLPRILARMGHTVKVVMPYYGTVPRDRFPLRQENISLAIDIEGTSHELELARMPGNEDGLEYLLIGNDHFFNRPELYRDPKTGLDYTDNDERFIFFSRGILETVKKIGWAPRVIHANDWQTALLPAYLATAYKDDPFFAATRTVYTIHNLAYQGTFPEETFEKLDIPSDYFYPTGPFEFWDKVNFMKSAISYATVLNTVSERYAVEIQSSDEYGCGLEGVLRTRNADLYGIVNGVDYAEWSPSKDNLIPHRYSPANLSGKRTNKVELVNRLGLPLRDEVPLIGMITRLADQKGFDLIAAAAEDIFDLDLQMVVLGTGEKKYHTLLTELESKYPDKLKALLEYDNTLAHWIEAGADIFLMPSRYEPCGLNQMYSLKYGTVPVVRATGGLADTIDDVDASSGEGTGFVFDKYDPGAMVDAIKRALTLYAKKRAWRKIMKNGMARDFSWENSARKYIELYRTALTKP